MLGGKLKLVHTMFVSWAYPGRCYETESAQRAQSGVACKLPIKTHIFLGASAPWTPAALAMIVSRILTPVVQDLGYAHVFGHIAMVINPVTEILIWPIHKQTINK